MGVVKGVRVRQEQGHAGHAGHALYSMMMVIIIIVCGMPVCQVIMF